MIHGIKLFKYRDVKSYLHTSVHNLKHIELRTGPYVYVYIYIYMTVLMGKLLFST